MSIIDNEIAITSLMEKDRWQQLDSVVQGYILKKDVKKTIRQMRAREILDNWIRYRRSLTAAAFTAFNQQPHKVTRTCRQILRQWEREIQYCIDNKLQKQSWYIIQAMSHPQLTQEAKFVAVGMLLKETAYPGFLTDDLYDTAEMIVEKDIYPQWEDMTMSDPLSND